MTQIILSATQFTIFINTFIKRRPPVHRGSSQYVLENLTERAKTEWEPNGRCRHLLRFE